MRTARSRLFALVASASLAASILVPSPVLAATARWTQFGLAGIGSSTETGVLRTSDGKLHLVWQQHDATNDESIRSAVLSPAGKVLSRGIVVQHWVGLETTPKVVQWGNGLAVVFNGDQDASNLNPYSLAARYLATSPDGTTWTLQAGSLSRHTVFNSSIAATTLSDGTLVTVQGLNNELYFHVGADPASPSTTADGVVTGQVGSGLQGPQLVRAADGSVWMGWFQVFGTQQGYWAQQILPTAGAPVQAPSSFNVNQINYAGQQVAMVARPGGGVYLAYCEPTATAVCAKVGLWKVGSPKAATVPGSTAGAQVTLSNGPGGRLVVGWYGTASSKVNVVWTNRSATKFSGARAVNPVVNSLTVRSLVLDATKGPVDLMNNVQQGTTGVPIGLWHTQILPALKLVVLPKSFSHKGKATLTFKVTDVGDPVAGVKVTFAGKSARTNAKGVAVIKLPKGLAKGTRTAVARVTNWQAASVSVATT